MTAEHSPESQPEPSPSCYHCGDTPTGVCRFCGRRFCPHHGSTSEMLCRPHFIGCLALWALLIALGITLWHFFSR